MFYDLDATGHDNTRWTAEGILPAPIWNMADQSVLLNGQLQSITAHLDLSQPKHYLRLHFFEEYDVPLRQMSETERHGSPYWVLDRSEFKACGLKFEVRKREGSGDTIVEVDAEVPFPAALDVRVQEALQYVTGKSAIWRARVQNDGKKYHLELASPLRKASQTQFSPPIWPSTIHFHEHVWKLFETFLAYVIANTGGTHWNPVAYHLYNACEATAASMDARAVAVSVTVEAVARLVGVKVSEGEHAKAKHVAAFQRLMRAWLKEQADFSDLFDRVGGQVNALSQKRPEDALYALAETGHVEKDYIKAWRRLRNRHVHPTLKDLGKPDLADFQNLLDDIHRVEVLLRQLTFFLIGYEGGFTDYGAQGEQGFVSKQYPLKPDNATQING